MQRLFDGASGQVESLGDLPDLESLVAQGVDASEDLVGDLSGSAGPGLVDEPGGALATIPGEPVGEGALGERIGLGDLPLSGEVAQMNLDPDQFLRVLVQERIPEGGRAIDEDVADVGRLVVDDPTARGDRAGNLFDVETLELPGAVCRCVGNTHSRTHTRARERCK